MYIYATPMCYNSIMALNIMDFITVMSSIIVEMFVRGIRVYD